VDVSVLHRHAARAAAVFAIFATASAQPLVAQDGGVPLALTNATVVDVERGVLARGQTVMIRGNRIAAVGAADSTRVPTDARVVDAGGRYLVPGLWDMHVHSAAAAEREFPLFVAHGVTGVRNMHTTVDTALALVASLKRRVASGALLGPRLVANGPIVDGPRPSQPGSVALGSVEAARRAVDSLQAGGADFIKVYLQLPRDVYFALAERAKERRIPMVGHVPISVRAEEAAGAGQASLEHSDVLDWSCSTRGDSIRAAFLGDPRPSFMSYRRARAALTASWSLAACRPAIEALKRNGTWVVPTLAVAWGAAAMDSALIDTAVARLVPAAVSERWLASSRQLPAEAHALAREELRSGMALVGALHQAGVPLLAGTDVGNPFLVVGASLHEELGLLRRAGLSPLEALRSATIDPARFLGATDSLGTIAPGKLADLVLLDADPLADIGNTRRIRAVVANGRYLDRQALDELLATARRAAASVPRR
jgi:imidazolonepropionase-like amidohydrolase